MMTNTASSAVTTGGTFSIGSEAVVTPNVRRARCRDIGRAPRARKRDRRAPKRQKKEGDWPSLKRIEVVLLWAPSGRLSLPRPPRRYAILRLTASHARDPSRLAAASQRQPFVK